MAPNCTLRGPAPRRSAQNSFNQHQKKLNKQHKIPIPTHEKLQSKKSVPCNEFSTVEPPEMCAGFSLEGNSHSYVRLRFSNQIKRRGLIANGSCANALPEPLFHDLQMSNHSILTSEKPSFHSVRMASGQKIPINKQGNIAFQIGRHYFRDSFLVLSTMNSVILGNPFFKKHDIKVDPETNLLQLPDLAVQLNKILSEEGKKHCDTKNLPKTPLIETKKVQKPPPSDHRYFKK